MGVLDVYRRMLLDEYGTTTGMIFTAALLSFFVWEECAAGHMIVV